MNICQSKECLSPIHWSLFDFGVFLIENRRGGRGKRRGGESKEGFENFDQILKVGKGKGFLVFRSSIEALIETFQTSTFWLLHLFRFHWEDNLTFVIITLILCKDRYNVRYGDHVLLSNLDIMIPKFAAVFGRLPLRIGWYLIFGLLHGRYYW